MRSGTNLPKIRDYNQGVVLEAVRLGDGASRVEIAEATGLNAQTVSNIVKRLISDGLVVEAGKGPSSGGKPRVRLEINAGAGYSVGVQLDGDEISFVVADMAGRVISHDSQPTLQERGPEGIVEGIASSVERIVNKSGIPPGKVLGVGVASTGLVDHASGVVYEPTNLLGWHRVPLKEMLENETGYPVVVDNDATAAVVGERWSGVARGTENVAFVYMGGMGIGAGLIVGDRVHRGGKGNAGEFGHLTLNPEGPECFCGNRGCVEVYCAPKAVVLAVSRRLRQGAKSSLREAYEAGTQNVGFAAIREAAISGDDLALEAVERSAWLLGCGAVGLANLLDADLVVLGGKAMSGVEQIYAANVSRALRERTVARERDVPRVELSRAGEDAAAVGAASLVLHTIYAPRLDGLKGA
jgi:glucokinase-like ROK family protein